MQYIEIPIKIGGGLDTMIMNCRSKYFLPAGILGIALMVNPSALSAKGNIKICSEVVNKNSKGIERLVKSGFDLDIHQCLDNMTPLMIAAKYNYDEISKILIEKGAPVDSRHDDGSTAIMIAVDKGNVETAKVLINHGAGLNSVDNQGRTALIRALEMDTARAGYKRTYEKMRADAESQGRLQIAGILIEKGADINFQDIYDRTPLSIAVSNGYSEITKLLIKRGAGLNVPDYEGRTALMVAAEGNDSELTKLLIKKGSNINAQDNQGRTALMLATEGGAVELIKMLIEKGAHANIKDYDNRTALMLAVYRRDEEIVKILIKKGLADIDAMDDYGETALSIAAEHKCLDIVKLLTAAKAKR